jgi:6,7-dimethyl-8-ribityllumazine synthase
MVVKSDPVPAATFEQLAGARVLVIEGRFYEAISDELMAGAAAALEAQGVAYDRISVPGALEIPQVLAQAVAAGLIPGNAPRGRWDGVVALGCVIRGETAHYDIVCNNANLWLMEVAMRDAIPVGNGILTVDTEAQALARARGGADGKGGAAARACLRLIELTRAFGGDGFAGQGMQGRGA